eukprot:Gregarina_sp_Poly_1__1137@NODE_1279_length_4511_cov_34_076508_g85_i1_p3_GENE_NODE_1279_length_4511_cov_34_076508_g85_i1NODE_1279_length_4511_cov_34_076508_g85_i1_p3_ORF_typecomplete_len140_score8_87_NODE_1279_length_4511_cov_34_076508_g85_i137694188
MCRLHDRETGRPLFLSVYLKYSSPFSKSGALFIVFLATFSQTIQAQSSLFPTRAGQIHQAFIHFDAWDDSLFCQPFHQRTAGGDLEQSFLIEDASRNVFVQIWSCEEEFSVCHAVLVGIFDSNSVEAFLYCPSRFICSQ